MSDIKVLDKSTIDKIAAGEVVEKPANVVKELMENAIDAGASAISIEIRDGGKGLIRVTDNGQGIPRDQIRTAFLRHATSKIETADDLSFVTTLGFRGEALSSIAAISDLELCTKPKNQIEGIIYKINAGVEISMEEAGLPDGTTIIITNLFGSVPARLKFLKSGQTEGSTVADAVEKIALSHPDIAIKFINNGAIRLNTPGNGSLKDAIYTVYGKEMTSNLLDIHFESQVLSIDGYIGKPEIARGNRNFENYFVNGRFVKDKIVASAIEDAYKGYQMKGTFPFTILNITMEPELLDVNVHPTKLEIRFYDESAVFDTISQAVSSVIKGQENIPKVSLVESKEEIKTETRAPEPFENRRRVVTEYSSYFDDDDTPAYSVQIDKAKWEAYSEHVVSDDFYLLSTEEPEHEETRPQELNSSYLDDSVSYDEVFRNHVPYGERKKTENVEYVQETLFSENFLSEKARAEHRIVGEVFNTYWIVQYGDEMYIIDQHAAHEKVLYERFMKKISSSDFPSQLLAPGIIVSLSMAEEECLVRCMFQLEKLGFEINHFGGSDYIITAVPADFYGLNSADLFKSFIDEMAEGPISNVSEMVMNRIATAACKAAVKGGNKISISEADALIDELLTLDNPYNCPHGRPTIISMSKNEIEKKFKRII